MFTLRTSTTDLDSWVENKYLLIFEINEEALHIEEGPRHVVPSGFHCYIMIGGGKSDTGAHLIRSPGLSLSSL
jgi:hypothetical protein